MKRVTLLLALILVALCAPTEGKTQTERTLQSWIPYWEDGESTAAFRKNVRLFDYLSVYWYRLKADGTIGQYSAAKVDKSLVQLAQRNGVKVMALIANDPDYTEKGVASWDRARVRRVIGTERARVQHAKEVLRFVVSNGYDGVDIDYENLEKADRKNFTRFIQILGRMLHSRKKLLGVAIHPKSYDGDPNGSPGSEAQDWKELGKHADRLYLMIFGEHGPSWSPPGPTAPIGFYEKTLDYAVKTMPLHKIVAETHCGAEGWVQVDPNKYKGIPDVPPGFPLYHAEKLRQQHGATLQWDNKSQAPFFVYSEGGKQHTVWLENERSFMAKGKALKDRDIPNFAHWALGWETPGIWKALKKFKE